MRADNFIWILITHVYIASANNTAEPHSILPNRDGYFWLHMFLELVFTNFHNVLEAKVYVFLRVIIIFGKYTGWSHG